MASNQQPSKDFSLFPSFDDFPDPPREEVVEPKSFRNTLIRLLAYMTLIPLFTLFFLLNYQIQSATKDADQIQIAIARNVASATDNIVFNTVKMLRLTASSHPSEAFREPEHARSVLTNLSKQQPALLEAAWVNAEGTVLESTSEDVTNYRSMMKRIQFSDGYAVAHLPEKDAIALVVKPFVDEEIDFYFVGLLSKHDLYRVIKEAIQDRTLSVSIFDQTNWLVMATSNDNVQESLKLGEVALQELEQNPHGAIVRDNRTRNVSQVQSLVKVPHVGWTVVVSEPMIVRDSLIRSSLQTTIIVIIISFIASIGVGFVCAVPLTRSINVLMSSIARFSQTGEFDSNSVIKDLEKLGTTEIVNLGHSFEDMIHAVKMSRTQLEKMNTNLEEQVSERTQALLVRNQELRILNALLQPMRVANDEKERELIDSVVNEFRNLLDLKSLTFIRSDGEMQLLSNNAIPVMMDNHFFGVIVLDVEDALTPDRLESLKRLAVSLSILLVNKKLVQQLAKEHATLATVFESITDGIVIIGRSGRIIYANELARRLLNNSQDIVGIPAQQLIVSGWKPLNSAQVIDFNAKETPLRLVQVKKNRGEKALTIDMLAFTVVNLPGFSGERTGLLIRDMTREAEIDAIKDNLLSVVAHELKTPVTAVRLQAEAIRHDLTQQDKHSKDLDELVDESSRLGQLIDDLLDLSRIEAGAMKLAPKIVQVASLIDRAARLTKSRYPIEIVRNIDPDAETFLGDPERITQVFVNLFNNAARYRKSTQPIARCEVNVTPQEAFVCIEVTDWGRGIAPELINQVCEPFFQADMTDHRVTGGTGLGLSIVKGIIEAHNGTLRLDSVVGEFTKFTICLPY